MYFVENQKDLYELTGLDIPIESCFYWLQGTANPNLSHIENENGFSQQGWKISITPNQSIKNKLLPSKVLISKGESKYKLIIKGKE